MFNLKTTHYYMGLLFIFAFLATGLYMRFNFPELYEGNEAIRFLYRANHIYLLAAGIVNLMLGLYLKREPTGWRRHLQTTGSLVFLLACPLLLIAFFLEPPNHNPMRPLTAWGLYAMFLGTFLHLLSQVRRR